MQAEELHRRGFGVVCWKAKICWKKGSDGMLVTEIVSNSGKTIGYQIGLRENLRLHHLQIALGPQFRNLYVSRGKFGMWGNYKVLYQEKK